MATKPTSLLEQLTTHWQSRGWDPADMHRFRMDGSGSGGGDGGDEGDGGDGSGEGGGGDGGGGDGGNGSGSGSGGSGGDPGFPADTPIAEMTAEQQAAYWRHHARRHESTAKARSDYDEIKAERDRLRQENETESEAKIRQAREEAEAEARAKLAPQLVQQAFKAEAKGVLTDDQRDALLEDLDLTKYLTDTGEVDDDKVAKKVAAFAPADDGGKGRAPGTGGQGRRQTRKTSATEAGRAEAAKRFGKTKAEPTQ